MAELAKAHNETLKNNLNEIREHLQKLNMKAVLENRQDSRRCDEQSQERRQNFERREFHSAGRRIGERRIAEDRRVPNTLSSHDLKSKTNFFPRRKKL
jgi:hypothetical protein